jgi:hypothetical protein
MTASPCALGRSGVRSSMNKKAKKMNITIVQLLIFASLLTLLAVNNPKYLVLSFGLALVVGSALVFSGYMAQS